MKISHLGNNIQTIRKFRGMKQQLPSGEMGRKDLIKIENTFLTDEQVNQLSLYAPQATVNRIDDYEVVGLSLIHILRGNKK